MATQPAPVDLAIAEAELDDTVDELLLIEREIQRREWSRDPEKWAFERLGVRLWSKQAEILHSVAAHRKTAVASCHEIGKSFSCGLVVGWWIDIHKPGEAFAVTTAPTGPQVRSILWREIGRVHSLGNLPGRTNQTEWMLDVHGNGKEEQVAIGRKPDEYQNSAFQGLHQKFMLVIIDEACGVPLPLWVAGESLIANDFSKMLVVGNPDDGATEFGRMCRPNSGFHVIFVGAFDTPNFTGEDCPQHVKDNLIGRTYVEDMRKRWAPLWTWAPDNSRLIPPPGTDMKTVNPYFVSKVLGQFPESNQVQGLIPLQWIQAAQQRELQPVGENELGVDVGGGGDSSTGCQRRGPVSRILWEDHNPDTMATCGKVVDHLRSTGAVRAKVDVIGIGRGVVDRGKEQNLPFVGVNVSMAPSQEPDIAARIAAKKLGTNFANQRAEFYWHLRTLFETGDIDIDPLDEALAAELVEIRFFRTSKGAIQVESKKDMLSRGVPSPNRADALMLAHAPVTGEENVLEGCAVW